MRYVLHNETYSVAYRLLVYILQPRKEAYALMGLPAPSTTNPVLATAPTTGCSIFRAVDGVMMLVIVMAVLRYVFRQDRICVIMRSLRSVHPQL